MTLSALRTVALRHIYLIWLSVISALKQPRGRYGASCVIIFAFYHYLSGYLDTVIEIWTLQLMWLEKWLSYRSPEILALVPRVHFVFEGGRRYRVVQSLYDLVVDCPRLPESVLRFKYIFKLTTKGGISLQDVPGSFSTTPLTPFSST